ncbi:type I polyketide synthase [Nocardia veterana]|uniref:SDR family NAD(P)-dependent oxidoreductase n=1 Tax=Nocardia veterana TaxID=132249 RepID=A0A7X6M2V2_9NOCA|nr:type I polyketide synthase [Nocardia veterana]NKY89338.1 SDR family NAD(P)-dependent oxidoreductase [Nocardia veterana]
MNQEPMSGQQQQIIDALRKSITEAERLRAENRALVAARSEPIAIIGVGCRFPGGVVSRGGLWEVVAEGRDVVGEFPVDRGWEVDDRSYAPRGGFVYDAGDFDAGFFGVGPREALAMDPQQRVLLEVAWEGVEDARIDPLSLRGSRTGVFAGVMYHDYGFVAATGEQRRELAGYLSTGGMASVVSGRVAYALGLEGPAVSVDTACSSSLVAIHQACQALRAGECDLALAGGVTVMATPWLFVEFSRQQALSPDGRCRSFGAGADGVGWGEGAGVVVLERLSVARARGRRVLGVVCGSAVNSDGASNGLTAPNGPSQVRVIRAALANAGLGPADVDVVEGHGTGTTLGDPIEAQALLATYGQDRDHPVWLGSVKSNMGHTQAAAGVAGVIKMVEAMRHKVLPRTLHADTATPHVDWSSGAVELLSGAREWPSSQRPRRAGVSSFGISGTNAHLILEEATATEVEQPRSWPRPSRPEAVERNPEAADSPAGALPAAAGLPVVPWPVSGRSADALAAQKERLRTWVETNPGGVTAVDIGWSLATTRAQLPWRSVIFAGADGSGKYETDPVRAATGQTVFVFPGQGSQWSGMGRELFECFPVFAEVVGEVCDPEWLFGPATDVDATGNTQLAVFAVEVGLFRLLESWGVVADVLVGHSIGEIAAAHVAGVFSLRDAVRLVRARARLMAGLPGGAMLAIEAAESVVVGELPSGVSVAAVNAPGSVVVSGSVDAIEEVARHWGTRTRVRRLDVSHAFHSRMVEPMLAEFETECRDVTRTLPRLPLVSNVTGRLESDLFLDPQYWVRHVRDTVRFADGIRSAAQGGAARFVEVGPDAALAPMISRIVGDDAVVLTTQRRNKDQVATLVDCVARAYCHGVPVDWAGFYAGTGARTVDLPTYAFQRQRFWVYPPTRVGDATDPAGLGLTGVRHSVLGAVLDVPGGDTVFTGRLSATTHPWLTDHAVFGSVLFPGTGFVELASTAGRFAGFPRIEELLLEEPLTLSDGGVLVRVVIGAGATRRPVSIYSRPDDGRAEDPAGGDSGWVRHCSGTVTADSAELERLDGTWPPEGAVAADADRGYHRLAQLGYDYGPSFRGVHHVWWCGPHEVCAEIEVPGLEVSGFGVHPALFDAALHAWAVSVAGADGSEVPADVDPERLWLPMSFTGVSLPDGPPTSLRVRMRRNGDRVSITLTDRAGTPVGAVDAVALVAVSRHQVAALSGRAALFETTWVRVAPVSGAPEMVWGIGDPNRSGGWGAGVVDRWFPDVAGVAEAVGAGARAPVAVVAPCWGPAGADSGRAIDVAEGVRNSVLGALAIVQEWVAAAGLGAARLVLMTSGAVTVPAAGDAAMDAAGLAQSGVAGLVRTAQLEYPGRLALLDISGGDVRSALAAVVSGTESEVALRDSGLWAPRLLPADEHRSSSPHRDERDTAGPQEHSAAPVRSSGHPFDGVVLVVGGGELAGIVVRHLVTEYGVRDVVLASRSGGVTTDPADDLAGTGVRLRGATCDVTVAAEVRRLVKWVCSEVGRLSAVLYTAGVLDDDMIGALSPDRVATVLRSKVDGAWHLHEATQGLGLDEFVLFSSVAGTVGSPGQANYAAANAFLDALAHYRRGRGSAARSIGWGLWNVSGGMAGGVRAVDRARMGRGGLVGLSVPEALELWDRVLASDRSRVVAARFDPARLSGELAGLGGVLPSTVRGLVRASTATPGENGTVTAELVARLAGLPDQDRRTAVLELVCSHVGAVLGFGRGEPVDAQASFLDLGFDSLAAMELRNRLVAATGVALPATVAYDRPTPASIAEYLDDCLPATDGAAEPGLQDRMDALEAALAGLDPDSAEGRAAVRRIRRLAARFDTALASTVPTDDDELFAYIDSDLGLADPEE